MSSLYAEAPGGGGASGSGSGGGNFGEVANANEYYRAKITGDELSRQRPAAVRQREREEKRAAAKGWQDF